MRYTQRVWLNQARFCFLLPDAEALPSQTQVKVDDDRDLGSLSWWEYAVVQSEQDKLRVRGQEVLYKDSYL